MPKRSREQILAEKLERLEMQKEDRINKYILPMETKIEEVREQIKALYLKKGIRC
jgi:hypothetical protein